MITLDLIKFSFPLIDILENVKKKRHSRLQKVIYKSRKKSPVTFHQPSSWKVCTEQLMSWFFNTALYVSATKETVIRQTHVRLQGLLGEGSETQDRVWRTPQTRRCALQHDRKMAIQRAVPRLRGRVAGRGSLLWSVHLQKTVAAMVSADTWRRACEQL